MVDFAGGESAQIAHDALVPKVRFATAVPPTQGGITGAYFITIRPRNSRRSPVSSTRVRSAPSSSSSPLPTRSGHRRRAREAMSRASSSSACVAKGQSGWRTVCPFDSVPRACTSCPFFPLAWRLRRRSSSCSPGASEPSRPGILSLRLRSRRSSRGRTTAHSASSMASTPLRAIDRASYPARRQTELPALSSVRPCRALPVGHGSPVVTINRWSIRTT